MERVGIRQLKDRLSAFVDRVKGGETVTITDRGQPVARLVPVGGDDLDDLRALAERWGSRWTGGKPLGLSADAVKKGREAFPDAGVAPMPDLRGVTSLAAAVVEDREEQRGSQRDDPRHGQRDDD